MNKTFYIHFSSCLNSKKAPDNIDLKKTGKGVGGGEINWEIDIYT